MYEKGFTAMRLTVFAICTASVAEKLSFEANAGQPLKLIAEGFML
jgi:hypothetical protein